MSEDIRGAEDQKVDTGSYLEHHSFPFLPIPIPSSFLPIPSVADAVVVVVGSWGSCWVKCANHQSPPVRAICRGEHRRPSKLIRRRAEAATGKQQLMSFQSMGLLMPLQFLLFFVVDAFWYRRIKIESDRSITYNIIQLRVTLFNHFTNQLTSRDALPHSMPPGNLRAGSPLSLRRHCWCSVGFLKLYEVVASQWCPTVCSTDFSGQIVHTYS